MAIVKPQIDELINRTVTTYTNPRVTSIGNSAFNNCTSLTTVDIPNAILVGGGAFGQCTSLTTVDFSNVTSIGDLAFPGCTALEKLIIRTPTVCSAGSLILIGADKCHIYVPDNLVSQYKSATNWSEYADRIHGLSEL